MGRRASLSPHNPMGQLAMQVAFTVPFNLLVVAGATLYRLNWFYPACMIVVGSHYLPFVFLYGMPMFYALGGVLVASGFAIGRLSLGPWHVGAWVTAVTLLAFGVVGRVLVNREGTLRAVAPSRMTPTRITAQRLRVTSHRKIPAITCFSAGATMLLSCG